jgi:hypothetical protein
MERTASTLTLIIVILFSAVVGMPSAKLAKANPDSVIKYLIGINIDSPENKTYRTNEINLNIYAYTQMGPDFTPLKDVGYSVDGGLFVYFADPVGTNIAHESVALNLTEGSHTIVAKAHTLNVQAGLDREVCANVTFTIDTNPTPTPTVPEFPSWIILPVIIMGILLIVVYAKRKMLKQMNRTFLPFLSKQSRRVTFHVLSTPRRISFFNL